MKGDQTRNIPADSLRFPRWLVMSLLLVTAIVCIREYTLRGARTAPLALTWPTSLPSRGTASGTWALIVHAPTARGIDKRELAEAGKRYWGEVSKERSWSSKVVLDPEPRVLGNGPLRYIQWTATGSHVSNADVGDVNEAVFTFQELMYSWLERRIEQGR